MTTKKTQQPVNKRPESGIKSQFRCPFCGQSKPLGQMLLVTRFFPPLVACRDCEKRVS